MHYTFAEKLRVPDCKSCHAYDEETRARLGCDRRAERPVFAVSCSVCGGVGGPCKACQGSGERPMHRCPLKCVSGDLLNGSSVFQAHRMFMAYKRTGTYPRGGGYADEPATLMAAFDIADAEWNQVVEHLQEEQRQEAERQRSQAARARKR